MHAGGRTSGSAANTSSTVGGVTQEREGYALAAGLALGLVMLGAGGSAPGLADINMREQLKWVHVALLNDVRLNVLHADKICRWWSV